MHYDKLLNTFPTTDHTHPRSKGGKQTVYACWDCNQIKRDMTLAEWEKFTAKNPRWWGRDDFQVPRDGARQRR